MSVQAQQLHPHPLDVILKPQIYSADVLLANNVVEYPIMKYSGSTYNSTAHKNSSRVRIFSFINKQNEKQKRQQNNSDANTIKTSCIICVSSIPSL